MNKVILIGRFTRDPESRMSQSNMEIARFSLACQGEYVSRNGEREVEFINCVAFDRAGEGPPRCRGNAGAAGLSGQRCAAPPRLRRAGIRPGRGAAAGRRTRPGRFAGQRKPPADAGGAGGGKLPVTI